MRANADKTVPLGGAMWKDGGNTFLHKVRLAGGAHAGAAPHLCMRLARPVGYAYAPSVRAPAAKCQGKVPRVLRRGWVSRCAPLSLSRPALSRIRIAVARPTCAARLQGTNGRWSDVLTPEEVNAYEEKAMEVRWLCAAVHGAPALAVNAPPRA